ncbi:hypothetical protein [Dehalococcoides mccartyi]|uniref:Uncharacterized protein n=1 Tax=Dehalococcoides mccartyi (strain CBDB1) TaxID=255470 RepID=A0A916NYH2_DEHMC|nr:hypothetical protein [Dehalococcoides mccartyi]CAI82861.1 hypothetical protein cbdbA698 [Dehalococcoides mccartyi CBDB1]
MAELITTAAQMGIGALFGMVMFLVYRRDHQDTNATIERLCQNYDNQCRLTAEAITRLSIALEGLRHG